MGHRQPSDYEPITPARRLARAAPDATSPINDWPHTLDQTGDALNFATNTDETAPRQTSTTAPAQPADAQAANAKSDTSTAPLLNRRAHLFTFIGLFIFTFVLYFRPYELIPSLSSFTSMAFAVAVPTLVIYVGTQFMLEGNLTARPREVNLVLLFVLTALLSIPLALNRGEAWDVFNDTFIKAVLMFIVMVNAVRSERRLRALMLLSLAVSCFLAVSAISDYRAGRLNDMGERVAGAVGGMFGNPNDMALHLVTMLPLAIVFFLVRRNPLAKLMYATCAVLLVAGIVVTFSRGGFLGLIAAGGVLGWKLGRRHKLAVGLSVVLAIAAFIALAPGDYGSRLSTITSVSSDITGSSSQRQQLLIRSIQVSLRHPLFGVGMGNFHIVSIHELVSHNAFTQVSADLGLTALVLYIWFMVAPLRSLRRIERETFDARRTARFYYYFAVGVQAALVGYMVSSFFASVAYNFYVYYLVGYAVALRRLYEAARAEEAQAASARTTDDEGATSMNDASATGAHDTNVPDPPPYSESYA
jgi:putative inorganic carbon (hco3(-)) transporter